MCADLWAPPVALPDDDIIAMHLSAFTCNRGGVASTAGRCETAGRLVDSRRCFALVQRQQPDGRCALVARHPCTRAGSSATAARSAQVHAAPFCAPPLPLHHPSLPLNFWAEIRHAIEEGPALTGRCCGCRVAVHGLRASALGARYRQNVGQRQVKHTAPRKCPSQQYAIFKSLPGAPAVCA